MKNLNILLVIFSLAVASSSFGEEWVIDLKPGKDGGGKAAVSDSPKLVVSASVSASDLMILLSDGKQKFGPPLIKVTRGENSFYHPRLTLAVPLDKVKAVKKDEPLIVSAFTLKGDPYELSLVKGDAALPSLKIVKQ